jgi:hypothetical protein
MRLSAFFNELGHSKFVRVVESYEEMDLALGRLHVCDINVKEPDQIALELLAPRLVLCQIREVRNSIPLQAPVQRGACQLCDSRLQGMDTIVQRQQRMTPECDHCSVLGFVQDGRSRLFRSSLEILDNSPLPPFGHRLRDNAQLRAHLFEASRVFRRLLFMRRSYDEQTPNRFSPEVRERAVRMVDEHRAD